MTREPILQPQYLGDGDRKIESTKPSTARSTKSEWSLGRRRSHFFLNLHHMCLTICMYVYGWWGACATEHIPRSEVTSFRDWLFAMWVLGIKLRLLRLTRCIFLYLLSMLLALRDAAPTSWGRQFSQHGACLASTEMWVWSPDPIC